VGHAVDFLVLAELKLTALTRPAETIMSTVPGAVYTVAFPEMRYTLADLDDISYNLVPWDTRENVPHVSIGSGNIREADATCEDFH
jgi:hypothetical protein